MTPRGTDWGLALLVALLFGSGLLTWFSAEGGEAWVFGVHGGLAGALGVLLVWKLARVGARVLAPRTWDRRTLAGLAGLGLVALALSTGWLWSAAGPVGVAGYSVLAWHTAAGALLTGVVAAHAVVRAKRLRRRDLAGRRELLHTAAVALVGVIAWRFQRPAAAALGLRGAHRRFTGSYEQGSFSGDGFPVTSWVADDPAPLDPAAYRLRVAGEVRRPLALGLEELSAGDELTAVLDCTGGFYTEQRWRGVSLATLLDRCGPNGAATHVRVVSVTGYRWSFTLADARGLLLATHAGDVALSHGHGAPVRLVAPGRRGFEWVKWVTGVEVRDGPDPGAFPSTLVSWL